MKAPKNIFGRNQSAPKAPENFFHRLNARKKICPNPLRGGGPGGGGRLCGWVGGWVGGWCGIPPRRPSGTEMLKGALDRGPAVDGGLKPGEPSARYRLFDWGENGGLSGSQPDSSTQIEGMGLSYHRLFEGEIMAIWGHQLGAKRKHDPPPSRVQAFALGGGGGVQGGFLVRSLVDGARSYSVAHRAGLLPTELTGMWGWILLRSPHQGRGSPPAPAPH